MYIFFTEISGNDCYGDNPSTSAVGANKGHNDWKHGYIQHNAYLGDCKKIKKKRKTNGEIGSEKSGMAKHAGNAEEIVSTRCFVQGFSGSVFQH